MQLTNGHYIQSAFATDDVYGSSVDSSFQSGEGTFDSDGPTLDDHSLASDGVDVLLDESED